ncbi:hypothetical protein PCASD_14413 [Puccinia coronata f. sp. avenae]|uniref:Uncharacterized protein n=1 Tax=Puccinia coronata f. sp. avenae TaxID=200324 RepID=A0A2N5U6T7_9BASI|nr:hypothetical protein PCASD_14413 [Puccinia coronata f. sp. avenae]
MAQIQFLERPTDNNTPIPSTPPDTSNHPVPTNQTQSVRQESSCLCTPSSRPGFISTQGDSCRSLVPNTPVPATRRLQDCKKKKNIIHIDEDNEDQSDDIPQASKEVTDLFSGTTQVASRSGMQVTIDHVQDLDAENEKQKNNQKKKDPTKDKDGFDHAQLYFHLPGSGPKQDSKNTAWAFRWCPNEFKVSRGSYYNLKSHCNGANHKGSIQAACRGCKKAIEAGAHLPPTAAEELSWEKKD